MLSSYQRCETAGRRDIEALLHLCLTHDLVDLNGRAHASERLAPKRIGGEIPLDEPLRHRADDDGIGCGQALEAGRNIRGVAQRELLLPPASPYLPYDDQAGVDAHADRQMDSLPLFQTAIENVHCLHNT